MLFGCEMKAYIMILKARLNFHIRLFLTITALACLMGCNSYDSDFIPFGLKGLDVYVYDDLADKEFYAGRVKANYFSSDSALSKCGNYAYALAKQRNLQDWSYVCCTVTSSSNCVTKVR